MNKRPIRFKFCKSLLKMMLIATVISKITVLHFILFFFRFDSIYTCLLNMENVVPN